MLIALAQSLFSCNHARTPVHEGKCYCPDCGRGVIYRWVILRCTECQARRESHYRFRAIVPTASCCALCGTRSTQLETLENPAYFQLHQARLMLWAERNSISIADHWLRYLFGDPLSDFIIEYGTRTLNQTRAWIDTQWVQAPSPRPALAFIRRS